MNKYPFNFNKIVAMVKEGKTAKQIAETVPCSLKALYPYLAKVALKPKRPRPARHLFSSEQECQIIDLYITDKKTMDQIAKMMSVGKHVICGIVSRGKIQPRSASDYRKYKVNEHFFDIIDDEHKAYFLGLLYADGCCMKRGTSHITHLGLQKKDIYMVEAFRDAVYPNRDCPIGAARNQRRVVINSKIMFEALVALGCYPRKSLTLKFPTSNQVPDNLLHHFIRGYFDGDGCIQYKTMGERVNGGVSFAGSIYFCPKLLELLNREVGNFGLSAPKQTPNIRIVQASRQAALRKFYDYIYKDASIFLNRKREKYDALMVLLNKRFEFWKAKGRLI